MNAIILAGGFGDRLKPFTTTLPKPALSVANVPMIDYTVSQLNYFGINDIVFALAYLPEKIIEWTVGYKGLTCHYNIESSPLGTCGAIKDAANYLDEQFFVLSGDGISDINLEKMLQRHMESGASVTMAVTWVRNPSLYGVLTTDKNGFVASFVEKPQRVGIQDSQSYAQKTQASASSYINCGVYIVNKSVLDNIPNGVRFDFARDLFPSMLSSGQKIAAYVHDGYWSDVGSLESYLATNLHILHSGAFFSQASNALGKHYASRHVERQGRSLVGTSSKLAGSIHNCVIGNGCRILSSAVLENCVVLDGVTVHGRHTSCIIDAKYAVNVPISGNFDDICSFCYTKGDYFLQ